MLKRNLQRYQYIIYIILTFGALDLYIRAVNKSLGYFSYFDITPILFTTAWLFFISGIITLLKNKYQKIVYFVLTIAFNILVLTQYLIIKIFDNASSFNTVSLFEEAAGYLSVIFNYFNIPLVLVIAGTITITILALNTFPEPKLKKDYPMAIMLILLGIISYSLAYLSLGESNLYNAISKTNVYETYSDSSKSLQVSGLYQYTARDIYVNYLEYQNGVQKIKYLEKYFKDAKRTNDPSELSGIFKDKNLILIQMESIDTWLVTKDIMPNLYKLTNEGLNFTNHFSPIFNGGATFNTEFMTNTGYMTPLDEELASKQYGGNKFPYSLPNLFKEDGYTANMFHENYKSYYNRDAMFKALGYSEFYSSLEMGIPKREAVLDTHFMTNNQLRNLIIPDKGKFMSFIITYSAHAPYRAGSSLNPQCEVSITNQERNAITKGGNEELICIKAQARETDKFFKLLLQELKKQNKLDTTVIIGISDHYIYGYNKKTDLYDKKGTSDPNFLDKTPFFIWSSDLDSQKITAVNSNLDILPTIADLFGLDYDINNYIGNNILGNEYQGYVFFSEYSWYDGFTYYKDGNIIFGKNNQEYINHMSNRIEESLKLNKYILNTNYFKQK